MIAFKRVICFFAISDLIHGSTAQLRGIPREVATEGRILSIEDFGATPDENRELWYFASMDKDFEESRDRSVIREQLEVEALWEANTAIKNTNAFNMALVLARPGDTVLVPDGKSFLFTASILAFEKHDITINFAGMSHFLPDRNLWPFDTMPNSTFGGTQTYDPAITIFNCTGVTLTSSSLSPAQVEVDYRTNSVKLVNSKENFGGIINGNGKPWWDDVISGKLKVHRPRLIHVMESADMLIENLTLINSPYWTLTVEVINSEVRKVNVLVDRDYESDARYDENSDHLTLTSRRNLEEATIPFPIDDLPNWIGRKFRQPQDLNTDGIDPTGENIWVHDCIIQNADDSVAVKPSHGGRQPSKIPDCTRNVTIENMILTGFGASIGSVPPHRHHRCVDKVLFRNITMPGTGKGIYVKSDFGKNCSRRDNMSGQITNILYEDVTLLKPFWWPIWIGPQQQHQPNSKLNMKCALTWPIEPHCPVPDCVQMENITLRNIHIDRPVISPAVILGNSTNPIRNIVIENLKVTESKSKVWYGKWPFHEKKYPYHGKIECANAEGSYSNSTPVPNCLAPR